MARITAILNCVRAALEKHKAPELTLVSRRTTPPTQYTASFPSYNVNEAKRFSIFAMLLSIHYLLFTGQVVTKREIFCQHFPGAKSQCTINRRCQQQYPADPFHQSRIRLSIEFPDKRLLQYDCGKLQRLDGLLTPSTTLKPLWAFRAAHSASLRRQRAWSRAERRFGCDCQCFLLSPSNTIEGLTPYGIY